LQKSVAKADNASFSLSTDFAFGERRIAFIKTSRKESLSGPLAGSEKTFVSSAKIWDNRSNWRSERVRGSKSACCLI
jgi:hypothetical protein